MNHVGPSSSMCQGGMEDIIIVAPLHDVTKAGVVVAVLLGCCILL